MDGTVKCADCGAIAGLYFDGEDVRVKKHNGCSMGGEKLEVNERARRAFEAEKRETQR
jgi:hypothetical protein